MMRQLAVAFSDSASANALLRTQRLDSTVQDRKVTLRGCVGAAAKQLILDDAWYIDGVREVIDNLGPG